MVRRHHPPHPVEHVEHPILEPLIFSKLQQDGHTVPFEVDRHPQSKPLANLV